MVKHYLFDFDGTLVDSMPTYIGVMLRTLDTHGISYPADIVKTITPLGMQGVARYCRNLGLNMAEEDIVREWQEAMLAAYVNRIAAKSNVPQTLRALKAQGFSLNVLTASPHITLDACLKRLGLFELFDHVWSCEDFGTTKADPAIYHRAAEQIGVPVEDVLFLDNNIDADRCAKSTGIQVFGVYDDSSADFEQEMRALCDGYVRDMSELMTLCTP